MLKKNLSLRIAVWGLFGFMIAPLIIVALASVNSAKSLAFPPKGFSLEWYAAILDDGRWLKSTITSLELAASATVISVLLAFAGAMSVTWWHQWRGSNGYQFLLTLPLIVPFTATGVALLLAFRQFSLLGTFTGFLLAHIVITLPFAFRAILMSMQGFDRNYFEAGMTLGANPWKSFVRIVVPLLTPGIAAGSVFAFLLSFDEATVSLLLVGPKITTLPVTIYGQASESASPVVAAVATLQILVVLFFVAIANRTFGVRMFTDVH